jgi:hypothetical protein
MRVLGFAVAKPAHLTSAPTPALKPPHPKIIIIETKIFIDIKTVYRKYY